MHLVSRGMISIDCKHIQDRNTSFFTCDIEGSMHLPVITQRSSQLATTEASWCSSKIISNYKMRKYSIQLDRAAIYSMAMCMYVYADSFCSKMVNQRNTYNCKAMCVYGDERSRPQMHEVEGRGGVYIYQSAREDRGRGRAAGWGGEREGGRESKLYLAVGGRLNLGAPREALLLHNLNNPNVRRCVAGTYAPGRRRR